MIILYFLGFAALCALGGLFARMDGGGKPETPEIVERLLCISFFVAACVPSVGWWSVLALAGIYGLATGHGQYFLSLAIRPVDGERMDFIVRQFFGRDPRTSHEFLHLRGEKWANATEADHARLKFLVAEYGNDRLFWRNMCGHVVTGTLVGLPAALVVLCHGEFAAAAVLSLTGVVKAASYYFNRPFTAPAEWCNGTFRTALALSAFVLTV